MPATVNFALFIITIIQLLLIRRSNRLARRQRRLRRFALARLRRRRLIVRMLDDLPILDTELHPLLEKHYIILFSHHIAFLHCCHTTRYTFHYTCHHFNYYYLLSTHTVHLHLFIYYIHTPKFIYLHTFTIYIVLIFIYSMVKDHNTVY